MATPISRVMSRGIGMGNAPGVMVQLDWSPTPIILAAQFEVLGLSVRSFHEPLKRAVQQVVAPSIRKNFDVEGRPHWKALADVTLDIRAREGFRSGPILTRTGTLKKVAGQLNIWTIDTEKAFVSDLRNASYGIVHQGGAAFTPRGGSISALARAAMQSKTTSRSRGGTRNIGNTGGGGSNTIPPRPFLLIQDEDTDDITRVFFVWLSERMVTAGLPGLVL